MSGHKKWSDLKAEQGIENVVYTEEMSKEDGRQMFRDRCLELTGFHPEFFFGVHTGWDDVERVHGHSAMVELWMLTPFWGSAKFGNYA